MPRAHKSTGADVDAIRDALVDLRRLFQRRELVDLWSAASGRATRLDYGDLRLLDAVRGADAPSGSATVGEIAQRLGIDPSRASRLVARAVSRKLLERRAAQDDSRKVVVRVTQTGARMQARGAELTRERIAVALAAWPAADRERFATLFARFAGALLDDSPARASPRRSTIPSRR